MVEAEKRGHNNVKNTPEALDFYVTEKALELFEENNVMNRVEVKARHEIMLEEYQKKIQIESRVLGDIAGNHIVPTAISYQNRLLSNVKSLKQVLDGEAFKNAAGEQLKMIEEISSRISNIVADKEAMIEARKKCNALEEARDRAIAYRNEVFPYLDKIRYQCDKLELMVDDELWPLPKYRELIFS